MDKSEIAKCTDTELQVAVDRCRSTLRADWMRGAPGRWTDVSELALLYIEAMVRGHAVRGPLLAGQLVMTIEEG